MIEKTYHSYYALLTDFLDSLGIRRKFTINLQAYNGFGITTFIKNMLLNEWSDIRSAIVISFPFNNTKEKSDYWNSINIAWQDHLVKYMNNDQIPFKSIWR